MFSGPGEPSERPNYNICSKLAVSRREAYSRKVNTWVCFFPQKWSLSWNLLTLIELSYAMGPYKKKKEKMPLGLFCLTFCSFSVCVEITDSHPYFHGEGMTVGKCSLFLSLTQRKLLFVTVAEFWIMKWQLPNTYTTRKYFHTKVEIDACCLHI